LPKADRTALKVLTAGRDNDGATGDADPLTHHPGERVAPYLDVGRALSHRRFYAGLVIDDNQLRRMSRIGKDRPVTTSGPPEGNRGNDDLAVMRGCLIAVVLGAALWAVIIAAAAVIWNAITG
jgi:hypothetical protein